MTDFALILDDNYRPQAVLNREPDTLLNAVLLSLHVKRGSWFFNPNFGCRLHEIKTISAPDVALALQYVKESLQWMIEARLATNIEVTVTPQRGGRLNFLIIIDGIRYDVPMPTWSEPVEPPEPPDPPEPPIAGPTIISFAAVAESETPEIFYDDDTIRLSWLITNATEAWITGIEDNPVDVDPLSGTLGGIELGVVGVSVKSFTLTARDDDGNEAVKVITIDIRGTFIVEAEFIFLPSQWIRVPQDVLMRWNVITPEVNEVSFNGEWVALADERMVFVTETADYYLRAYIDNRRLRGTLRKKMILDGGLDMSPWIWGTMGAPRPVPIIPVPPEGVWRDEHSPVGALLVESIIGSVGAPRPLPDIPIPEYQPDRVWFDEHSPVGALLVESIIGTVGAPRPAPDIPNPDTQPDRVWLDEHSPVGALLVESIIGEVGAPRPAPIIPQPPYAGEGEWPAPDGVWRDEHKPAAALLVESIFGEVGAPREI